MENVDAILNKENKPNFMRWIIDLNDLGYVSSYKVLNAKDYGIPQNRDRCFMVSTLTKGTFRFPKKRELKTCLKDYLDKEVGEDYYLSQEKIAKYKAHAIKMEAQGMGLAWRPLSLSLMMGQLPILSLPNRTGQRPTSLSLLEHLNRGRTSK